MYVCASFFALFPIGTHDADAQYLLLCALVYLRGFVALCSVATTSLWQGGLPL